MSTEETLRSCGHVMRHEKHATLADQGDAALEKLGHKSGSLGEKVEKQTNKTSLPRTRQENPVRWSE